PASADTPTPRGVRARGGRSSRRRARVRAQGDRATGELRGVRGEGRRPRLDPRPALSGHSLPADRPEGAVVAETVKYPLSESELPEAWYNVAADLPEPPAPVLHPGTGQPVGPDDLAPLFPMEVILQEVSTEARIAIPEEVRAVYRQWRPTPLYRARRLERALDTPARIFYKYEGVSPTGSHKPNTAVAQAFYNAREGVKRLVTETGAGQWGSSLAMAGAFFGL